MGSRSATELLQLPVQLHGIRLGRPVDLLLDPAEWRALGFVVLCGDESSRFLVFAAADLREDAIEVRVGAPAARGRRVLPRPLAIAARPAGRRAARPPRQAGRQRRGARRRGRGARSGRVRSPFRRPELPSRATVGRPAATLQPPRRRLVASLLSVRNWQQLGKFCVVGAVGYLINLAVYDALLHAGLHYLLAATCSFLVAVTSNYIVEPALDVSRAPWACRQSRGCASSSSRSWRSERTSSCSICWSPTGGWQAARRRPIAIVLVTPLNFVGNKLWSFRGRRH